MRRLVVVGVALGGLLACKTTGSSGDDTDGGSGDTGDTPAVGENQVAVVTHVDGVDTSFSCDLGVDPGASGSLTVDGSSERLIVSCIEIVSNQGQNMASFNFWRDTPFAEGPTDVSDAAYDGSLAVVLTDENGDGWQTAGGGWSGQLTLDEIGAAGGGAVRGSLHGEWPKMQQMSHNAPTGDAVARAGSVDIGFDFTRP